MKKSSSSAGPKAARGTGFVMLLAVLAVSLGAIFFQSFLPNKVLFSNDGPFGLISSKAVATTLASTKSAWLDLNWLGTEGITADPTFSMVFSLFVKPIGYAKFAAPIGLLLLGLSAWLFFRQLRLAPLACVAGGVAAALNSDFFSTSCWGIVSQSLCVAANYLALAALAKVTEASACRSWLRVILAGLAVGMAVMQGWDVGALFSLFVAAYVVYQALFLAGAEPRPAHGLGWGAARVAVVAAFAAFAAAHTMSTLIGTQIKGVAGLGEDQASREAHRPLATEWSLPKKEILQVAVPGLFGYRNNWHMGLRPAAAGRPVLGRLAKTPTFRRSRINWPVPIRKHVLTRRIL